MNWNAQDVLFMSVRTSCVSPCAAAWATSWSGDSVPYLRE